MQSHARLQQPLAFKQNDDHQRTLRREVLGDSIEAGRSSDRRLVLFFYNHEPGLLPAVSQSAPRGGHGSCLFLNFKISIRSTQHATEQLYSASEPARSGAAPVITSCRPVDSPTFLHERPESLTFDIIFSKQPFLKDSDTSKAPQSLAYLREAIKLKAATVSVRDGMRSQIQLTPTRIYSNNKEYREDEFHVGVVFDVAEFAQSATEKLLHAQLHINKEKLVDRDQAAFALDHYLDMRGLPIYVFEETDLAQVLKEEGDAVRAAVEGEAVGAEAEREVSADVSTRKSDLELQG